MSWCQEYLNWLFICFVFLFVGQWGGLQDNIPALCLYDCCPALLLMKQRIIFKRTAFKEFASKPGVCFHLNGLSAFNKKKQALRISKYLCTDGLMQGLKEAELFSCEH